MWGLMTILEHNFTTFWNFYTLTEQEETAEMKLSLGDSALNHNVEPHGLKVQTGRK